MLHVTQKILFTNFNFGMEINNLNNQTFGVRLSSSAVSRLKNSGKPEMLSQLNKTLRNR